jgi:hypothetical protein
VLLGHRAGGGPGLVLGSACRQRAPIELYEPTTAGVTVMARNSTSPLSRQNVTATRLPNFERSKCRVYRVPGRLSQVLVMGFAVFTS